MIGTVYDWNAPVTKTLPLGHGKSQSFIVVFTTENTPQHRRDKAQLPAPPGREHLCRDRDAPRGLHQL